VDSTYFRTAWQLESLKNKIKALHAKGPAIWITHGGFSALAMRQLSIPFLHVCHGFGWQRPPWIDEQDRLGIQAAEQIFPVSGDIARQLREMGIQDKALQTAYYPLQFNQRASIGSSAIENLAVVGNLIPLKGQRFAIEALAHCLDAKPESNLRLHLYGEGPDESKLKALAKDLGIKKRVLFHGFCEMEQEYDKLDLLLVPSLREGLGMAILEAFEFAIPVCAFKTGGIPELVVHNQSGLLSPTANAKAMAQNILTYLEHPEKAPMHIRQGQTIALSLFNPQKNTETLLNAAKALGLNIP